MVDNITPNQFPITYEKSSAPEQVINNENIIKTDLASFDCKVGSITNISTNFKAMMPLVEDYEPYKNTLIKRCKLLRRYIGDSIDSAKGIEMKNIPKTWVEKHEIYENDNISTIRSKKAKNRIVAHRKPYFMIDLYDTLYEEYKTYRSERNINCKLNYKCSLDKLIAKKDKTKEEKKFISDYYEYMPVLLSKCVMNELSWYVDSWEKENFVYTKDYEDCTDLMVDKSIKFNKDTFEKVKELYYEFMAEEKNFIKLKKQNSEENSGIGQFYDEIRERASKICNNSKEFANYAVEICYKDDKNKKKHKRFVWCIAKDGLIKNIKLHKQKDIEVPVIDDNGQEYLGKKYSLVKIKDEGGES